MKLRFTRNGQKGHDMMTRQEIREWRLWAHLNEAIPVMMANSLAARYGHDDLRITSLPCARFIRMHRTYRRNGR
jgi:hypothetical protein